MEKNKSQKVIIAMSGGVDSSVAAASVKKAGFNVIGAHMKLCGGKNDSETKARAVAKKLNISFYVFNFEKEFKKKVVDYFLKEYKAGRTPNPCVVCNKEIKFGLLLEKALKLGADYIATGHYARIQITKNKEQRTIYKLLKGKDKNKDQSYFLWRLNQKQLKSILFPVAGYTKSEVRDLAKKFKLPTARAPESQEVCFIPKNTNDFLEKFIKPKPGNIIDISGKIIGKHSGLFFYTIGQRKGIGLSGGPYYVVDKNIKKNILVVSKNGKGLYKKELITKNISWISGLKPKMPIKVVVKIRYRHKPAKAVIYKLSATRCKLRFEKPQRAITSGQSIVFYRGDEVLGGGIIM